MTAGAGQGGGLLHGTPFMVDMESGDEQPRILCQYGEIADIAA
jgi:hypothetical protein